MRTNRCEVERFAQPVFAQPHPIDFPTRDLRQDWMRGTGIGLFGVVVLSAVFFDSTSSWCSVPMFVIHSMHAGFLLVSRPFFFADHRAFGAANMAYMQYGDRLSGQSYLVKLW